MVAAMPVISVRWRYCRYCLLDVVAIAGA